jgi:hypothetical protein
MKRRLSIDMRNALVVALALALVAHGAVAADDKAQAQVLLHEGNALLKQGRADEALGKFIDAYRLFPSPKLHYNLGQAHAALPGHEAQAYVELSQFIDDAPDASAELRAAANTKRQQLRAKVALVTVLAPGAGDDAAVLVDGVVAGKVASGSTPAGRPVVVGAGTHKLMVARGALVHGEQAIVIAGGETLDIRVGGASAAAAAASSPSAPPAAPAPAARTEASTLALTLPAAPPPAAGGSTWTWQRGTSLALGVLAVASLALGIVQHIAREDKAEEFRDAGCGTANLLLIGCQTRYDAVKSAEKWMAVGYVGAAVLGGASVTLLWLSPSPVDRSPAGAVAGMNISGVTVTLQGRY